MAISYVNYNRELKLQLFGKIVITITENLKRKDLIEKLNFISPKQYSIMRNFIVDDLKSLRCNFPSIEEVESMSDKYYNYIKCCNNAHNNKIPDFKTYFETELELE